MKWSSVVLLLLIATTSQAATKVHVIAFGKWMQVQVLAENVHDGAPVTVKVRALIVDGRVKEYAFGAPHEVTERMFVVRQAYRVNDALPEDLSPHWQWQCGGWLLVDRLTGRVSAISLPEFDAYSSAASWYRDYVAYCGVGDDGKKTYAMVVQLGRRKVVLRKVLPNGLTENATAQSVCPSPSWQRKPIRVSFAPSGSDKQTFAIRGSTADVMNDSEEEE